MKEGTVPKVVMPCNWDTGGHEGVHLPRQVTKYLSPLSPLASTGKAPRASGTEQVPSSPRSTSSPKSRPLRFPFEFHIPQQFRRGPQNLKSGKRTPVSDQRPRRHQYCKWLFYSHDPRLHSIMFLQLPRLRRRRWHARYHTTPSSGDSISSLRTPGSRAHSDTGFGFLGRLLHLPRLVGSYCTVLQPYPPRTNASSPPVHKVSYLSRVPNFPLFSRASQPPANLYLFHSSQATTSSRDIFYLIESSHRIPISFEVLFEFLSRQERHLDLRLRPFGSWLLRSPILDWSRKIELPSSHNNLRFVLAPSSFNIIQHSSLAFFSFAPSSFNTTLSLSSLQYPGSSVSPALSLLQSHPRFAAVIVLRFVCFYHTSNYNFSSFAFLS